MDLNEAITKACTNLNSKLEKHPKCMIYRVHRHLRDVKCSAYEPEVVSIGPYHRGKDHLKMMEDHKLLNLQLLVKRQRIDIMKLAAVVGGVASEARKCYADQDFELSKNGFIEMLVLDGCFIIELVLTFAFPALRKKAHPIFQMEWMICSLQRDLMLFENQVPFFVLRELFNSIRHRGTDCALVYHLSHFFNNLYPGSERSDEEVKSRSLEVAKQGSQEILHILDLIHRNWLPRESQKSEEEKSDAHPITFERKAPESQESKEESDNIKSKAPESQESEEKRSDAHPITIEMKGLESQESEEKKSDTHTKGKKDFELMYCATRLTEANVEFKVKKAATSLFDIEFKDGTMVMPPLRIVDETECLFRNLIAYEQYFKKSPHDFVTQYTQLLDRLINSSKDVEILSGDGIITNYQGDDKVVANMVNRLGDSIASRFVNYAQLFEDVSNHYRETKNWWMAKLRRDYLHSPWAVISILAALLLLLLTIVQTVFTILQVVQ